MDWLKLEYEIKKNGFKIAEISKKLGMSRVTFYKKSRGQSEFTRREIEKLIEILSLENPSEIFFSQKVS